MVAIEALVAAVPWALLEGAYGVSDANGEHGEATDVRGALLALASETETDSDEWSEAIEVLQSHVWHQGTIYPVTVAALPIVIALAVELPPERRLELAQCAALMVMGSDADDSLLGRDIRRIVAQHEDALLEWLNDERQECLAAICVAVPELRPRYLDLLEHATVEPGGRVVLAHESEPPTWAMRWAARAVCGDDRGMATVAAVILARSGTAPAELHDNIQRHLRGAPERLEELVELPIPMPTIPRFPPEQAFDAELARIYDDE
ncbi:MAG: hypothetical protein AAF721_06445 [Myxococcota bacterium]